MFFDKFQKEYWLLKNRGDWGFGIGDWRLGIGNTGQGSNSSLDIFPTIENFNLSNRLFSAPGRPIFEIYPCGRCARHQASGFGSKMVSIEK